MNNAEKPKKKKGCGCLAAVVVFIVVFVGVLAVIGSGDESDGETYEQPVSIETQSSNAAEQSSSTEKSAETAANIEKNDEPEQEQTPSASDAVPEIVLVDESNVKITAKSLDKSGWLGPELKLLIENNSDKNLTFQVNNVSVNGYMVSTSMSEDVASGKKANGEITFMNSSIKACGIETFADIELSFHIFDDDWNNYLDTEQITIRTSAADTYNYSYDDSGDEIYNNGGIRVISKGLNTGDIFGKGVVFMIYNGSDRSVTVSDRDCSINGFMLDPNLYAEILPGKYAIDDMDFWTTQLEENEITDITDIEFTIHISDSKTWTEIDNSAPIVLHFD